MKQVVQSVGDGQLRVVEVPAPTIGPAEVLVATTRSLLSTGTEKAVRELASASLLDKARARPDLVRQVIKKAKAEGLRQTVQGGAHPPRRGDASGLQRCRHRHGGR